MYEYGIAVCEQLMPSQTCMLGFNKYIS